VFVGEVAGYFVDVFFFVYLLEGGYEVGAADLAGGDAA